MKILIIHCTYQFKGGEDSVVAEELKLLQRAGHTVELLLFSNEKNTLLNVLLLPFNPFSYFKTKKRLEAFQPDVVHLHNLHFAASPSVVYAVNSKKLPLVCTLHNYRLLCPSATLFYKGQAFLLSLKNKFPWKAVQLGVYKNSRILTFWMAVSMQLHYWLRTWSIPNRIIVLSQHARKMFLQSKGSFRDEQLIVKPNFCTVPPELSQFRKNIFLFVGRLTQEKGIPFLLNVFSGSVHKLRIAGDGPLKETVLAAAQQNGNIEYLGPLKKEELSLHMQQSTALIFPSIWYEGMPLTIIEAFSCGLPVIATRLGAMEYMVTPGYDGLLFEAGNKEDLQNTLNEWVCLKAEEKERISKQAKSTYQKFYTPEDNRKQLLAVYQSVKA